MLDRVARGLGRICFGGSATSRFGKFFGGRPLRFGTLAGGRAGNAANGLAAAWELVDGLEERLSSLTLLMLSLTIRLGRDGVELVDP